MSSVKIHFLAEIRSITGKKCVEVPIGEAETIASLLRRLSKMFGEQFRKAIFDSSGQLGQNIIVRHNGENILVKKGSETETHAGDTIVIMRPVAGG